jgi:hypothetical protein
MVQTGATFRDAAAEYMPWLEHDRARKPSTLPDTRSDQPLVPTLCDQERRARRRGRLARFPRKAGRFAWQGPLTGSGSSQAPPRRLRLSLQVAATRPFMERHRREVNRNPVFTAA